MNLARKRFLPSLQVFLLTLAALEIQAQGPAAPPTPRAAAGLDLTGYWVSVVSEDWRYRMVTPRKGDYDSLPLNAQGRAVADTWDPAKDIASGNPCKAYGAAALMRIPGRIRISWQDDDTLKIETEAGTQTRMLDFVSTRSPKPPPSLQGVSLAEWEYAGRAVRGAPLPRRGHLKVLTTNLLSGYLRKNGVPYSADAVVTEYYNRTDEPNGDSWLIITTMVDDPQYLTGRFVTSTHFKKLGANDTNWNPEPCSSS